jgi:hypothetical protein
MGDSLLIARLVVVYDEFFPKDGNATSWSCFNLPMTDEKWFGVPSCKLIDLHELPTVKLEYEAANQLTVRNNIIIITMKESVSEFRISTSRFETYCYQCNAVMNVFLGTPTIYALKHICTWNISWEGVIFHTFEHVRLTCERCYLKQSFETAFTEIFPGEIMRFILEFIEI